MARTRQRKKTATKPRKQKKTQPEVDKTEVLGWVLLSISVVMLLSLLSFAYGHETSNWLGLAGYSLGWLLVGLFGMASYIVCIYLGWIGWQLLFKRPIEQPILKHLNVGLLAVSTGMLLSLIEDQFPTLRDWLGSIFFKQMWEQKYHFHLGGAPLFYLYSDLPTFNLNRIVNAFGVGVIFSSTLITSVLFLTKTSPRRILDGIADGYDWTKSKLQRERAPINVGNDDQRFVKVRTSDQKALEQEMMEIKPERNLSARPSISSKEKADNDSSQPFEGVRGSLKKLDSSRIPASITVPDDSLRKVSSRKQRREAALSAQSVYNGDFSQFKVPPPSLLTDPKKVDQTSLKKDLRRQAEVLEETLHSFGIDAKVGQINCGPTITSFEVHPAIGVKVQKIKTLENDIALNMEAKSIRILAPIPGKAAIGIEVPNPHPQEVSFKEMLTAYKSSGKKFNVPILFGKTVTGEYLMNDLTKMPHCIIAGATGSGKSVCINSIVMSILMNAKPDEIKLIMVDPKKVELTPYTKLPHMLAPVITEPAGACAALGWLVKEMESRYDLLKQMGVRNISAYNDRKIDKDFEESLNVEVPKQMHFIVCIIDELADLMMVSSNNIETHIARIAQMARAVGIHLILATQRPSREVITGLIKANFPTRISFKVASRVNSQIILDETGAESLLGNGDLLFLPPGSSHLVRAQGAFVRDEDINTIVRNINEQAPPNYVIKSFDDMDDFGDSFGPARGSDGPTDSLYDQALDTIVNTGNASTTFLQRKLKVGYARAASIIDQLEANGVVGPADGAKPRKILINTGEIDE